MITSGDENEAPQPMSDAEIEAAARSDPDAQPLTEHDLNHLRRVPQVKVIRRALDLKQEEFAERFGIPIATLKQWEQGELEPDQTARTYLKVIARDPTAVAYALRTELAAS